MSCTYPTGCRRTAAFPRRWQHPTTIQHLSPRGRHLHSCRRDAGRNPLPRGFGIRLAGFPTVIIFAIRALANGSNSFTWLRDVLNGVIAPRGDWTIGATYFGVAMLLNECPVVGSGRWSVDLWLSKRIEAVE
jgi:hypothetical protein